MSKVLILAPTGFGKSTSIGEIPELDIVGLNPKETFVISCTNKPLPFGKSSVNYVITTPAEMQKGNRIVSNNAATVAKVIEAVSAKESPYINIVIDDLNYVAQDYYMENALKGGWDTPKQIGYNMALIFKALEINPNKNYFVLAHSELVDTGEGLRKEVKMKTTGEICPLA
jgi:hypothetical protein